MPIDRERQRLVKEGVAYLRAHASDALPDDGVRTDTLAEGLAVLAAKAREAGNDEGLWAEITLRAFPSDRETLREARLILAALGYGEIAGIIKRLERSAPRRLSRVERLALKAKSRRRLLN